MTDIQKQAADLLNSVETTHENQWVAIAPDYSRVIGAADTLPDLMRSIQNTDAIFHRVLPHDVSFAPAT